MRPEPSSLDIDQLESRMRPGGFSQTGFLGPQERLEEVLASDAKTATTTSSRVLKPHIA
jgi:hypothetical protein